MSKPVRPLAATVAGLALAAAAAAQDDLRDVVRLENGKEVRGRVVEPFTPGQLLVVQGGKRVRVDRDDVASMQLVGDAVREFLERRRSLRQNARAQWILVEWAQARGLLNLARLQATCLALDADDERAHALLGHKKRGDRWLWEHDGRWLDQEQLATAIVKTPFVLAGERFRVRAESSLRACVDAAFDLEQLGVWWMDTYGAALYLREVLRPIDVHVHRDATSFPKWGFRPIPYYVPEPHGDVAHTLWTGNAPVRPRDLFFVGTQGLLYRTLIGNLASHDERDRACAWLEIGLPQLAEQSLGGDAGFAAAGPPRALDLQAMQALSRDYRLTHLLHLPMYGGFYLMDDTPTAINWSAAATFVQFLLRPDNVPDTRSPFLSYVRAALGERKGDSSSLFDAAMGRRIDSFDEPFRRWLEKAAGN
jgi:hypothetical protein